jgi:uncharacterized membrane protein YbhN (UPF0104 family)
LSDPRRARGDEARRLWTGIAFTGVAAILIGALVLAVPALHDVVDRLEDVAPGWVALAVLLELGSCAGYVLAFRRVFRRVPPRLATRVALAELAFGAVVPAGGAGGIAVGAWVANAMGASLPRFLQRSGVLFLLTSAINAATLAGAGLLVGVGLLDAPRPVLLGLVPGLVATAAIAAFWLLPRLADRLSSHGDARRRIRWLRATAGVVRETREEVRRPSWGLAGAVAYLWCDVAMLWVSLRAFGTTMPIGALVLAFLIGYLGNVLPVPGGLGALDGGLAAALILYGAAPASAAAGVLLYHAIVLWLPTVLGTVAFLRLRAMLDRGALPAPRFQRSAELRMSPSPEAGSPGSPSPPAERRNAAEVCS